MEASDRLHITAALPPPERGPSTQMIRAWAHPNAGLYNLKRKIPNLCQELNSQICITRSYIFPDSTPMATLSFISVTVTNFIFIMTII
jgi:hypothetical protein